MKKITLVIAFLSTAITCFAQRGKNGNLSVAGTSTVTVNEYTTLTADAAAGSTSITVATSALNTKGRFSAGLATGDLVMIIQMQGATINGQAQPWWDGSINVGLPMDSSWGSVTAYNNCGNYEFAEVSSVPNGTTIQFDCGLTNSYTAAGRVQVIRVPRYNTLTVNAGGSITCDPWDSVMGGVVAVEVLGNSVINGNINATGEGFRGATLDSNGSTYGVNNFATNKNLYLWGKTKGEGIAGFEWMLDQYGGRNCKGADANGGGGADAHNAGGGGGANGGVIANWVDGIGVPDISTTNNKNAWKLEYSWLPTFVGTGGGRGGYTFSSNIKNPTTTAPNNAAWGGDHRASQGGLGGRPLDYSTGKIFLGGGGGAGDEDDNVGGAGGNGGGMVYVVSYGTVSGTGQIQANGANGVNSTWNNVSKAADGAGGAGGGGTVIVNSQGNISGITIQANGGNGGNQVIVATATEAEGPGGGGGGGYIAATNSGFTETANGGSNGTTNATSMKNFPPNGATSGGIGTVTPITNFQIVTQNDTFCKGSSPTLTANLTGTVPAGTTVEWYTTSIGGSPFATGNSYTTGVLTKDTILYIGTCPGTYRQPINITISASSSISISSPTSICAGGNTTLTSSGGTAYSWSPAGSLNNANISNPIASPTVTTTYTVTITTPCGPQKDSVVITVTPGPSITATATPATICAGNASTLNASGATTYTWSPATGLSATTGSSVIASPPSTETITVTGTTAGCVGTQTVVLTVNPIPTVTITPAAPSICAGTSTMLNASGAATYTWSPNSGISSTTGSSVTVNPASTITYSITGTASGCSSAPQTVVVTVNPKPSVTVTPPAPGICSGGSVNLTASGASTYAWSPAAGLSATSGSVVTANPASTQTFTIIGTSALGCNDTTKVTVTVGASLTASISGKDTVCLGSSTTLTASGGSNYAWSNGASSAAINVSPATNTTYSVMVSSGTCKDSAKVTVVVSPPISGGISGTSSICTGSSTTLTATGGGTYSWNTGATTSSINVSPVINTGYTVQINKNGCSKDTNITVTVSNPPVVTISKDTTICSGNGVTLKVTGGGSYAWSNGSTNSTIVVSPASTTTYTVGVNNGCVKDTNTVITVKASPVVTLSGTNSICQGSSTTITATGGGTYTWSGGSTSTTSTINVSPAATTTYSLQVSNGTCAKDTSVIVSVNAKPSPGITGPQTICAGDGVNLIATGGATYTWTPAAGLSNPAIFNPVATPATTTIYTVTVANGGCSAKDSVTVTVKPAAAGNACCSTTITSGESTTLEITSSSGGETFSWSPTTGLSCNTCQNPTAKPTITTVYYVTITDSDGCSKEDSVTITVKENCGTIFVPEAFSPNGDGKNDVLYVRGDCIQTMDFQVYDRWGNKVFESTSPSIGWDGEHDGQPMNAGSYVYYLNGTDIYNNAFKLKGNITLVR